ncbi:hypothetical protein DWZ36_17755 [Phocaeicola vulgatus]|jgi:hypothetical protein|uniref:hypothetical protein n=1 Tax=Phocaeicola vulgatus TaxID=821 RepID=UPI000E5359C2|nr:hypothetical protein [Phocaeicola vulgatus]RHM86812.1 hypothetical protein DWZ36_17755 [Phocaeicola vulgatus]
MKNILLLAVFALAFVSCDSRKGFDSLEEMKAKSSNIKGVYGFTMGDDYDKVALQCKSMGYDVVDTLSEFVELINNDNYKSDIKDWRFFIAEKNGISQLSLEFYEGKLCIIRGFGDLRSKGEKNIAKNIMDNYGLGISFDTLYSEYKNFPLSETKEMIGHPILDREDHYYVNDSLLLSCILDNRSLSYMVVCTLNPYARILNDKVRVLDNELTKKLFGGSSSSGSTTGNSKKRGRGTMDADDKEYWNSVNREKKLRDMGMKDAAELERKARIRYLEGGGYNSKDGGKQVHFQGSKEQEEQLRQMDEMGW